MRVGEVGETEHASPRIAATRAGVNIGHFAAPVGVCFST
jgi:hypothetical protein